MGQRGLQPEDYGQESDRLTGNAQEEVELSVQDA